MNRNISAVFSLSAIVLLFVLWTPSFAFADWNHEPYAPGTTLNPECAPTDDNCTVIGPGEQWIQNGSDLLYNDGSIKIATSSLGSPNLLTLESNYQDFDDGSGIAFRDSNVPNGDASAAIRSLAYDTGVAGLGFYVNPTDALIEAMRIDSNGNVGIGTNNPSAKLSIQNTATGKSNWPGLSLDFSQDVGTLAGASDSIQGQNSNYAPAAILNSTDETGSSLNATGQSQNMDLSAITLGNHPFTFTHRGIGVSAVGSSIEVNGTPTFNDVDGAPGSSDLYATGVSSDVSIATNQIAGSHNDVFTSGGSFSNGTVATGLRQEQTIGVRGTNYSQLDGTQSTAYGGYFENYASAFRSYGAYIYSQSAATGSTAYDLYLDGPDGSNSNDFSLYSASTAKSYFAGNVGIGTSEPDDNLTVNGGIHVTNGGDDAYINFGDGDEDALNADGYGFRVHDGVMQFKNEGDDWTDFGAVVGGSSTPDLSHSTLEHTFDISDQTDDSFAISFGDDGHKMYIEHDEDYFQYSLSTPWDVSTASYDDASIELSSLDGPWGFTFKSDGTQLYVTDQSGVVHQFPVETPWDISSVGDEAASLDASDHISDGGGNDVTFSPDGSKVYIVDFSDPMVYEYELDTPWDLSSASYDTALDLHSDLPGEINVEGIHFTEDGARAYIGVSNHDNSFTIHRYTLATPWDISSATSDDVSFTIPSSDHPEGMFALGSDETSFYATTGAHVDGEGVAQYTFATTSDAVWSVSGNDAYFAGGRVGIGTDDISNSMLTIDQGGGGGGELITNGTFASDTGWNFIVGWHIQDGAAVFGEAGSVTEVVPDTAGSGYTEGDLLTINDGTGDAVAEVTSVDDNGGIVTASVDTPGTTYDNASLHSVTGGTGSGAILAVGTVPDGPPFLVQEGALSEGSTYTLSFDVGGTYGGVAACIGDPFEEESTCDEYASGSGHHTLTGAWHSSGEPVKVFFAPASNVSDGTIDNVSLTGGDSNTGITFVQSTGATTLTIGLDEEVGSGGDEEAQHGFMIKTVDGDGHFHEASIYPSSDDDQRYEYYLPSLDGIDTDEYSGGTLCVVELNNCGSGGLTWVLDDDTGNISFDTGDVSIGDGAFLYSTSTNAVSINNLSIGALSFPENAGAVSWIDLPVTADATAGSVESYIASIGSTPALTVYGESDGAGGVQNLGVGIGTSTPAAMLDVNGSVAFEDLPSSGAVVSLCLDGNGQVVTDESGCGVGSTEAIKHDINALTFSGTSTLMQIVPSSFVYNNDASSTVRWGFIAQNLAFVNPAFINAFDANGQPLTINPTAMLSVTVKAIQELITTVQGFADHFTSNQIDTQKLCVGGTCVTEDQFKAMLQSANAGSGSGSGSDSSDATSGDSDDATDTPPAIIDDASTTVSDDSGTSTPDTDAPAHDTSEDSSSEDQ